MQRRLLSRAFGTLTHIAAAADGGGVPVPRMVSVAHKPAAASRRAVAEALVVVPLARGERAAWRGGGAAEAARRAALFSTAVAAGVMGAKRTAGLIPMCHGLMLTACDVRVEDLGEPLPSLLEEEPPPPPAASATLRVTCAAEAAGAATGVEMEALTGCSVAALTLYDMLKSHTKGIVLERVRLLSKTGGKSGDWRCADDAG